MGNELEETEKRAGLLVSVYFLDALKHYVEHQKYYHEMIPEQQRTLSRNTLPLYLMEHIISHLSDEKVDFETVLQHTIGNAKASSKLVSMVGIFQCKNCGEKDTIPIEVKTTRDDMSYFKNGQFNYEQYMEYEKTEEIVNLNLMVPEIFAPGCSCNERAESEYIGQNTSLGIQLSEKDVEDLQSLVDKENKKQINLRERSGKNENSN